MPTILNSLDFLCGSIDHRSLWFTVWQISTFVFLHCEHRRAFQLNQSFPQIWYCQIEKKKLVALIIARETNWITINKITRLLKLIQIFPMKHPKSAIILEQLYPQRKKRNLSPVQSITKNELVPLMTHFSLYIRRLFSIEIAQYTCRYYSELVKI